MSKKIVGVVALAGLCALSLFLVNCGSSGSRPAGVLYVLAEGTTDQGTPGIGFNVSSYGIDLNNGGLSLINSDASTCPAASAANPEPCGTPLDILLDPAGATAFVLNQGIPCILQPPNSQCEPTDSPAVAPSIYPYRVNSDGSLLPPGSPVSWTCTNVPAPCPNPQAGTGYDTAVAMTRDAAGQFLFVIDYGVSPSPTDCPPAHATDQSNPIYLGCPSIMAFAIQSTTLTPVSGTPLYLNKIPSALSTITFTLPGSSTPEEFLFVTNNQDICVGPSCIPPNNDNTVSAYVVDPTLTLCPGLLLCEQTNSPYTIAASNPISVLAVNTNQLGEGSIGGVFVYVGNQGAVSGAVNPFQLCTVQNANCSQSDISNSLLVPVNCAPSQSCAASAGESPVAMVADPTNNFLYVVSNGLNQVFAYGINTLLGTLTTLGTQPSQGLQPVSIALHPSGDNTGQYLFVSNSGSQSVAGFTLSTTAGTMSNPIAITSPPAPSGVAVH
jgi:hypothetical protein